MSRTPLVVLGYDVGDAGLIERFAGEGLMPVAARILERGVRARTTGSEYMTEHGLWVALATGLSRTRTGYYYFRQLVPGSYELRPTTARDFEVAPLWSELAGGGRRGAVIDVPDAPLVEGLDGVQLLDFATHQPRMTAHGPSARPSALLGEASRVYGRFEPTWEFEPGASEAVDRAAHAALIERVERKARLCRHLLSQGDFDFVCVAFSEAHPAGHRFWRYGAGPGSGLGGALRDVYVAIDRAMGEVLEAVGGEPDVVLLASIGMATHYPTPDLADGFCHLLGYQVAPRGEPAGPGLAGRLAAWVPERLRGAIAARLPQSVQERRISERFRTGTDWSRTVAFAIPGLHAGFIRVNLAGREPAGTVDSGAGYRGLVAEIEAELSRLVDPVSGGPAVRRVYRTADLTGGAPPEHLPDLVVEWHRAPYFLERLIHARGEIRQAPPHYCPDSYHSLEGLFAAAGPSIAQRGDLGGIDVLDAAPTCLGLLGVPAPAVMGGRDVLAGDRLASRGASS
jgi:predicted AlkP superfamily phosphohydrolase/phosphomutase